MRFIPIVPFSVLANVPLFQSAHTQFLIGSQLMQYDNAQDLANVLEHYKPFTIIDNGAYEGDTPGMAEYYNLACSLGRIVGQVEIVIPDVMRDCAATLSLLKEWNYLVNNNIGSVHRNHSFMFVPQGRDFIEWLNCLYSALNIGTQINTIGIPKWVAEDERFAQSVIDYTYSSTVDTSLAYTLGEALDYAAPNHRKELAQRLCRILMLYWLRRHPDIEIVGKQYHLLGMANLNEIGLSEFWRPNDLPSLFNILKTARSMDSTFPFMVAHEGSQAFQQYFSTAIGLGHLSIETYLPQIESMLIASQHPYTGMPVVKRPDNFFNLNTADFKMEIAEAVTVYLVKHFKGNF